MTKAKRGGDSPARRASLRRTFIRRALSPISIPSSYPEAVADPLDYLLANTRPPKNLAEVQERYGVEVVGREVERFALLRIADRFHELAGEAMARLQARDDEERAG